MNDVTLDAAEHRRWSQEGLLMLPAGRVVCTELAESLDRWTDELSRYREQPGKWMMYFETSSLDGCRILNRIENFVQHHDGFMALHRSQLIHGIVAQLVGEPVVLFKDKVNFKQPGADGFKPHQDAHAWEGLYEGLINHVTVAVAIDAATSENGCLEFVAGRHRGGLIGSKWEEIPPLEAAELPWFSLPMERGDVVVFHSYTPHRSAPNTTLKRRRMLFLTYNLAAEGDLRARYYADKRKSYPPDCERRIGVTYEYKI